MKLQLRKFGNSTGLILPAPVLQQLHVSAGDKLSAELNGDALVISAARPKYALDTLLAQCDLSAPMPSDLQAWQDATAVGCEAW
ncbi:AbrB/MazE/SpoVT family DNA-binding domain-containing protein [Chitinilyticum piscinae]|uniref:PbsX family transcriptional regulator n=1 Tax=Chitinilyticum piscinae TaxID=2866724 RepID=A0A8J7FK66_9NEIS|nr:PbsX family transcriptional regulator [Chitinilyticum piscinae]MBE9610960.1 PbsX family transcriptional regulator [Chitinilyticum piscinae]